MAMVWADSRTFDEDYRMTALKDATSGSVNVQSLAYVYDVANNLKTITDSAHAANSQGDCLRRPQPS